MRLHRPNLARPPDRPAAMAAALRDSEQALINYVALYPYAVHTAPLPYTVPLEQQPGPRPLPDHIVREIRRIRARARRRRKL